MLDFVIKGGPVLWIIMGLSLVAAVIILERFIYFKKIHSDESLLFQRVRSSLQKGHFDEAMAICDTNVSPLSSLLKLGIEHRDSPEHVQKEIIKDAAAQEVPQLEKRITAIGTIAHISPLLGLLGTVTGTMRAFGVLGRFGAVADPSILALGVSEALITTVGGICVAVPCVIFYNILVSKANNAIIKLENQVNGLIQIINSNKSPKAGA
jgi:biopolymer transport protein ExbB